MYNGSGKWKEYANHFANDNDDDDDDDDEEKDKDEHEKENEDAADKN